MYTEQCGLGSGRPGDDVPGTVGPQRRLVRGLAHRSIGPDIVTEGAEQDWWRRVRGDHRTERQPQHGQHKQQQHRQDETSRPGEQTSKLL